MKDSRLLPHRWKTLGWILWIPSTVFGLLFALRRSQPAFLNRKVFALYNGRLFEPDQVFSWIRVNLSFTLIGLGFIGGSLLLLFSRENPEDEFIRRIRLESLLWAVGLNYGLLVLCFILLYGTEFQLVMVYNMFTTLILFLLRFHYLLWKNAREAKHEK